ncbi:DNA (cytosine-5-)-methyltransferase [Alphaproteobacteria bacterium]|nr:DNA (cytosine-5-)-methyltransferase [Alphaproteobacteria bacterium]
MKKIKVTSLFCGCGGADLGLLGGFEYLGKSYKKLPFIINHASDFNTKAVNTYNANFQHKAEVIDVKDLNLPQGFSEVLIGGFPCQPFSTVNPTKDPSQKENQLFWEMARVIDDVKPKVFVAENVQGFYRLKGGFFFDLACQEFRKIGYEIFHHLVDSSDYGVPQKRKRIFIVGVRTDIQKQFIFPNATHGNSKPKAVLSDVINSLWPDDPKYFFSKRAVEGVKKAKPNMKRALAQKLDDQCLTITSHLAKVSLNSRDPVLLVSKEEELYRRFTPREAASIQSFPNSFFFEGSEGDAYRQIGNAIPPVVMWHISKSIYNLLQE